MEPTPFTHVSGYSNRFKEMFPNSSAEGLSFLKDCLRFNPSKRISADGSLKHPYVTQFHNPADEPACPKPISIPLVRRRRHLFVSSEAVFQIISV